MNLMLIKKSIEYSQDIVNITKVYVETMENYFQNMDNQIAHEFCYKEFLKFKELCKEQAKERGLIK